MRLILEVCRQSLLVKKASGESIIDGSHVLKMYHEANMYLYNVFVKCILIHWRLISDYHFLYSFAKCSLLAPALDIKDTRYTADLSPEVWKTLQWVTWHASRFYFHSSDNRTAFLFLSHGRVTASEFSLTEMADILLTSFLMGFLIRIICILTAWSQTLVLCTHSQSSSQGE